MEEKELLKQRRKALWKDPLYTVCSVLLILCLAAALLLTAVLIAGLFVPSLRDLYILIGGTMPVDLSVLFIVCVIPPALAVFIVLHFVRKKHGIQEKFNYISVIALCVIAVLRFLMDILPVMTSGAQYTRQEHDLGEHGRMTVITEEVPDEHYINIHVYNSVAGDIMNELITVPSASGSYTLGFDEDSGKYVITRYDSFESKGGEIVEQPYYFKF